MIADGGLLGDALGGLFKCCSFAKFLCCWIELPLDGARAGREILEGLIGVEEGCGD
jgi:hypothetical protein